MERFNRMTVERKLILAACLLFFLVCLCSLPSGLLPNLSAVVTASASPLPVLSPSGNHATAAATPRPPVGGCGPFCSKNLMR